MKRGMLVLVLLVVAAMLCVSYAAGPFKATTKAVGRITNADTGEVYTSESNEWTVVVLDPPKLADAVASWPRGVPLMCSVSWNVAGPEWQPYELDLPIPAGATFVEGSFAITGGTGALTGTMVTLDPLEEPGEVVCTYQVVW